MVEVRCGGSFGVVLVGTVLKDEGGTRLAGKEAWFEMEETV